MKEYDVAEFVVDPVSGKNILLILGYDGKAGYVLDIAADDIESAVRLAGDIPLNTTIEKLSSGISHGKLLTPSMIAMRTLYRHVMLISRTA